MKWKTTFLLAAACRAALAAPSPELGENGSLVQVRHRQGASYKVTWIDARRIDLRLRWKSTDGTPYASIEAARDAINGAGDRFVMATNAGIFDRAREPLGLHVEEGKTLKRLNRSHASRGNFFMNPNGVFFVGADGAVGVMESAAFTRAAVNARFASQSGPLLVREGEIHPAFRERSENARLRSGVGVDARGFAAFAISRAPVSFYDFAAFFRDELGCKNALYFDGDISTLISANEPSEQIVPYVGIWTASVPAKRPPPASSK